MVGKGCANWDSRSQRLECPDSPPEVVKYRLPDATPSQRSWCLGLGRVQGICMFTSPSSIREATEHTLGTLRCLLGAWAGTGGH